MPDSAYYRPVINPPGGASVSSVPLDMERDYIAEAIDTGIGAYRARKEATKQKKLEDAKAASMIAEATGQYTPELQERVLAVTGEDPTIGEKAVGGLGRLIGIDTRMGEGTAPVTLPEGQKLRTGYEREIEKAEREAGTKYNQFLRDLFKEQYKGDITYQNKLKEKAAGITVPRLSFEQQMELVRERARAAAQAKKEFGKPLSAREQLMEDIYTGEVGVDELDEGDFLVLGKYWNTMTPEARAKDALTYAQKIVEATAKGSLTEMPAEQRSKMVDELAAEYVAKQNDLIAKFKGQEKPASGGPGRLQRGRPGKGGGKKGYEERDEKGRRTLDSLFGGAY